MSLVSFLARLMDLDGTSMMADKRSFDSKNRVGKSVKHAKKKTFDRHVSKARKMQEKMETPPPATSVSPHQLSMVLSKTD